MSTIKLQDLLLEVSASEKAKKQGLTSKPGGKWYDKQGNYVARTIDGKLTAVDKSGKKIPTTGDKVKNFFAPRAGNFEKSKPLKISRNKEARAWMQQNGFKQVGGVYDEDWSMYLKDRHGEAIINIDIGFIKPNKLVFSANKTSGENRPEDFDIRKEVTVNPSKLMQTLEKYGKKFVEKAKTEYELIKHDYPDQFKGMK